LLGRTLGHSRVLVVPLAACLTRQLSHPLRHSVRLRTELPGSLADLLLDYSPALVDRLGSAVRYHVGGLAEFLAHGRSR
jgi:hypothetical protein